MMCDPRSLPRDTVWALAEGVHAAIVDDDVVLLSVTADGYFCLPGAATVMRRGPTPGAWRIEDPDLAADLVAGGLAAPASVLPSEPGVLPELPRRSLITSALSPPTWSDLPDAIPALFEVLRRYRHRPFAEILATARCGALAPRKPARTLETVARRFHSWVPYAPVSGKCLLRSRMLLGVLRRAGYDAVWVFAVRTWPFVAHCWLQVADQVLDDDWERLQAFTPILAV